MMQNNLPEILISIKPRWCDMVGKGLKTLEIRKTKPKVNGKFKCYIYQTKESERLLGYMENSEHKFSESNGKIIGEFICDGFYIFEGEFHKDNSLYQGINVIKYDEDGIEYVETVTSNDAEKPNNNWLCKSSCLRFDEIKKYVNKEGFSRFYGWVITDLKTYDKPIELSDFMNVQSDEDIGCKHREQKYNAYSGDIYFWCKSQNCFCNYYRLSKMTDCDAYECRREKGVLKRAPQSWCYVEKVVK